MITPRLAWVVELQACLNRATGGQIKNVRYEQSVDPLKVHVHLDLHEEWEGKSYKHLVVIAQAFAKANDCVLERILKGKEGLVLEILLKRRLGPVMCRNPMKDG